jgi:hypothetical protein
MTRLDRGFDLTWMAGDVSNSEASDSMYVEIFNGDIKFNFMILRRSHEFDMMRPGILYGDRIGEPAHLEHWLTFGLAILPLP